MRSVARRSLRCSLFLVAATTALGPIVVGCGGSGNTGGGGTTVTSTVQRDTSPDVAASDESSLVGGNTNFAFALYQGLSAGGSGKTGNLFYSPYSVSLALAMAHAGANGTTASQMATALDFPALGARLDPAFDKLDLAIETPPKNATGDDGAPFALTLADSLWGDAHVTFGQTFVNTLAADYRASLRTVDFVHESSQAEDAINAWVASKTNDKIDPLLGPATVDASTELVIVNAVYFNAGWQVQFEKSATQTGTFTRADGSAVQAPMMFSGEVASSYVKGSNYQAVDLPYSGGTTSMVVVLPDTGAYDAVEKGLTGAFYGEVTQGLAYAEGTLTMPRFKIHGGSVDLSPELKSLGMSDAFDPSKADFTKMIPAGGAYISFVIHQAFVDVDESGTEAAAATAVGITGSAAPVNPFSVVLNRPYFFFIRDVTTHTVLFVGREGDPTAD